jgi:DNA-binding CsgD family transcriptional regulator
MLARLVPHLGAGLRKSLLIDPTATASEGDASPGLIELSSELEVIATNPAAEAFLVDLARDRPPDHGRVPLPLAVYSVVSQLRAVEARPSAAAPPRLQVQGRSGRWLTLHASRLGGTSVKPRTAVIIEPTTPLEIAPLIVHAYGLTRRESEICRLVLQGLSTAQISQRLHISTNTVQGHLQAIFEKTDVRSRRELAGQLFSRHYWPLLGEDLGTQGRFAAWADDSVSRVP